MTKQYLFIDEQTQEFFWSDVVVNKKGVCLKWQEVEILKMLYTHKIMPTNMILEMFMAYTPDANKKSMSNRISRLAQKKILYLKKYASVFNYVSSSYLYAVGELGFEVLKFVNDPQLNIRQKVYEPRKVRIPNLHNFYAIESMHQLFIANVRNVQSLPIAVMRGAAHESFHKTKNAFKLNNDNPIIPDYVITLHNTIICFESDMGTERGRWIKQKEEMYCRIKNMEAFRDKRMFVVFSVVDERDNAENAYTRTRRIHAVKAAHRPARDWPELLEFYVVSSSDVVGLILNLLLTGLYPVDDSMKELFEQRISDELKKQLGTKHGWQLSTVELSELLIDKRQLSLLPAPLHAVKIFTHRGTIKSVVLMNGEFGSVRTYQEVQTVSKILAPTNDTLFKQPYLPVEMMVCYLNTLDLTTEHFGFKPPLAIHLVEYDIDQPIRSLRLTSSFKKESNEW